MSKKKAAAKSKTARGVRNLPAKTLSAKAARNVKGGEVSQLLMQACATGTHYKKGSISH